MEMNEVKTLNDLKIGDKSVIKEFDENYPHYFISRFMALGLLPGVEVEILCSSPMGEPVQIKALDSFFALRQDELKAIIVSDLK